MERLAAQLAQLESAQLVRRLDETDLAYLFKHGLTQDTAYGSLLLKTRCELHRRVAQAYETLYPDRLDDYAAVLAHHYAEAGEPAKTLEYARRAAQAAARLYAYSEATAQYTRALTAAAQLKLPPADLLHARGQAFEFLGDFDHALSDFQAMLAGARSSQDHPHEWLALMDLGYLWATRDYAQVGEFFRQALELAEQAGDPKRRAESLTWLANWQVNIGQTEEGLAAHRQALEFLQSQDDPLATAETLDLLGMANLLQGDFPHAAEYLVPAIEAFRELDNQRRLISSLSSRIAVVKASAFESVSCTGLSWDEYERATEEVLQRSRDIGWAAGQAYALIVSAQSLPGFGQLGQALELARAALDLAREIGHDQWTVGARSGLGQIYLYLLDPDRAIEHLEPGLESSRKLGSAFWTGVTAARLARAYLLKGDVLRARELLIRLKPQRATVQNLPERQVTWVRGLLALGENHAQEALAISEQLIATAPGGSSAHPIPALYKLKGEALVRQKQYKQGIQSLQIARDAARSDNLALVWEIELALGQAYLKSRRHAAAVQELDAARRDLQTLAATVTEPELRDHMLEAALRRFPAVQ